MVVTLIVADEQLSTRSATSMDAEMIAVGAVMASSSESKTPTSVCSDVVGNYGVSVERVSRGRTCDPGLDPKRAASRSRMAMERSTPLGSRVAVPAR